MKKRLLIPLLVVAGVLLTVPMTALADNGHGQPTLSFFSGGAGGHADWFVNDDQPPGDTDHQSIRLQTTFGGPTFEHGYAGVLVHHVTGIPAAAFPDSSFWNKTPEPYFFQPLTLGSPRLVVAFQNAVGEFDGYGALRENARGNDWEFVSDVATYPNSAWDVMGGPCVFLYNVTWPVVQSCFSSHTTLTVFLVADAYGIYHLIDRITVNGKTFSSASDNGNGNNSAAGPEATLDPSLLPPIPIPLP